jgi:MFS family permease
MQNIKIHFSFQWNLVCDEGYKADLVQSFYMAGFLVGSLIFGTLADAYGRRRVIHCTCIAMSVLTLLGMTAPSYGIYVLLRCLTGMLSAGFGMVTFTYTSEVIGQSKRGFLAIIFPAMFAVGIAVYSLLAWFIRDWRYLAVSTAVPGAAGFYFYA